MSKIKLFLTLANPDEQGVSRWVKKTEFINEYLSLDFNNGCPWARSLKNKFQYETIGFGVNWKIRLSGLRINDYLRPIRDDIRKKIESMKSVHSGLYGNGFDMIIVDHKNGRYSDDEVLESSKQNITHFQPLLNRENLQKRQDCKNCRKTNKRFDAKTFGYSVSFTYGDEEYVDNIGCRGCYWFDVLDFKSKLTLVK